MGRTRGGGEACSKKYNRQPNQKGGGGGFGSAGIRTQTEREYESEGKSKNAAGSSSPSGGEGGLLCVFLWGGYLRA